MRVLLLGGTGVLSQDIAQRCVDLGYDTYLLNRGKQLQFAPYGSKTIIGNVKELATSFINQDSHFDVVVDFLSYNRKQIERSFEFFKDRCQQFIVISSATIYNATPNDMAITESNFLPYTDWSYTRGKIDVEHYIKQRMGNKATYTIVRPYITYGKTRIPYALIPKKAQWTLIQYMLSGQPVPVWDSKSLFPLMNTVNFAEQFVKLFLNSKAINETYHIVGNEYFTWPLVIEEIAKALGIAPQIKEVSLDTVLQYVPEAKEALENKSVTRIFNTDKLYNCIGECSPFTRFLDGMHETLGFYKLNPEFQNIDHIMLKNYKDMLSGKPPSRRRGVRERAVSRFPVLYKRAPRR